MHLDCIACPNHCAHEAVVSVGDEARAAGGGAPPPNLAMVMPLSTTAAPAAVVALPQCPEEAEEAADEGVNAVDVAQLRANGFCDDFDDSDITECP